VDIVHSISEQGRSDMAKEVLEKKSLEHLLKAVSHLVRLPKSQLWLRRQGEVDAQRDEGERGHARLQGRYVGGGHNSGGFDQIGSY